MGCGSSAIPPPPPPSMKDLKDSQAPSGAQKKKNIIADRSDERKKQKGNEECLASSSGYKMQSPQVSMPSLALSLPPCTIRSEFLLHAAVFRPNINEAITKWSIDYGELKAQLVCIALFKDSKELQHLEKVMKNLRESVSDDAVGKLVHDVYKKHQISMEIPKFDVAAIKDCMKELYRDFDPKKVRGVDEDLAEIESGERSLSAYSESIAAFYGEEAAKRLISAIKRKFFEPPPLQISPLEENKAAPDTSSPQQAFFVNPLDIHPWIELDGTTYKEYKSWLELRQVLPSLLGSGRVIPCEYFSCKRVDMFHRNALGKTRGFSSLEAHNKWRENREKRAPESGKWGDIDIGMLSPRQVVVDEGSLYSLKDQQGKVVTFPLEELKNRITEQIEESEKRFQSAWESVKDHLGGAETIAKAVSKSRRGKKDIGNDRSKTPHTHAAGWITFRKGDKDKNGGDTASSLRNSGAEQIAAQMLQIYYQALLAVGRLFPLAMRAAIAAKGQKAGATVIWELKGPRAYLAEVCNGPPGRVAFPNDVARCTIVLDTCKEVSLAVAYLAKNADVMRIKNRTSKSSKEIFAHRDVIVWLRIAGHVCQIRFVFKTIAQVFGRSTPIHQQWMLYFADITSLLQKGEMVYLKTNETDKDGKAQGVGEWRSVFGEQFLGSFKDGAFDVGVYTQPDGRVYMGEFQANQPHGSGRTLSPCGIQYTGDHQGGRPNGRGEIRIPGGLSMLQNPYIYVGQVDESDTKGLGVLFTSGNRLGDLVSGHFNPGFHLSDNASKKLLKGGNDVGKSFRTDMSIVAKSESAAEKAVRLRNDAIKSISKDAVAWDVLEPLISEVLSIAN